MSELFFRITFAALFIVYILIRVPFDKKYKQEVKIRTLHQSGENLLLVLMSLGLLVIPLLWLFTPFLDRFSMEFPVWLRLSGVALSIVSLFYFRWIHQTLGENWSPTLEIREGHQLIRTGPYKTIRHPMYAQIFLWTIAQVFIISNLFAGFSGLVAMTLLYFVRVPREEKMLEETFGEAYRSYKKQTGRVVPKLNGTKT